MTKNKSYQLSNCPLTRHQQIIAKLIVEKRKVKLIFAHEAIIKRLIIAIFFVGASFLLFDSKIVQSVVFIVGLFYMIGYLTMFKITLLEIRKILDNFFASPKENINELIQSDNICLLEYDDQLYEMILKIRLYEKSGYLFPNAAKQMIQEVVHAYLNEDEDMEAIYKKVNDELNVMSQDIFDHMRYTHLQ